MIAFVALIALATFLAARPLPDDMGAFLSRRQTTAVNGIATMLILLSHARQYLKLSKGVLDTSYLAFRHIHHQWVVATFLAFSGFGVMWCLMREGSRYVRRYPRDRLLKTLVNFDVAILLYLAANTYLGVEHTPQEYALALVGYASVGNSNWYLFTILVMYLASYVAALVCKRRLRLVAALVSVASVAYVEVAIATGLPARFVSTVCCYPLGMWLALEKERVWRLTRKLPLLVLAVCVIPIVYSFEARSDPRVMNVSSLLFVAAVVTLMAHIDLESPVLAFFGRHAFTIYVIERIPMMLLASEGKLKGPDAYAFVVASAAFTICGAIALDWVLRRIDALITSRPAPGAPERPRAASARLRARARRRHEE